MISILTKCNLISLISNFIVISKPPTFCVGGGFFGRFRKFSSITPPTQYVGGPKFRGYTISVPKFWHRVFYNWHRFFYKWHRVIYEWHRVFYEWHRVFYEWHRVFYKFRCQKNFKKLGAKSKT